MFVKFPLLLLLYNSVTTASSSCGIYCDCGPPARPVGTSITIQNESLSQFNQKINYENDSKIKYKCLDPINQLIGSKTRSCHLGKWLGSVPRCGKSMKN